MNRLLAAAVLAALDAVAGPAAATPAPYVVDTFSFTQGGFAGAISPGSTGLLSGTFTGRVEDNGTIQRADLSALSVTYQTGGTALFGYGPAVFFSYIPGSDSTLDLDTGISTNGFACVGAVAAFGFGQCGFGDVNGEVAGLDTTQALPVVKLVSSTVVYPPPIPVAVPYPYPDTAPTAIPEPAGWSVVVPAFLAMSLISLRRRLRRVR